MPRRTDIHSILIIGAGPIIIGQGCEFDYSGTQACKALKEEGYRVILVNSNPATIMTDPEFADATYIEPITVEAVTKIIEKERPDALLPTLGGQTGLNTAVALFDAGVLTKYGVKMIGANREAIHRGEDRKVFKEIMEKIGLKCPNSGLAYNMEQAREVVKMTGLPCIIRASFTLGGTGSGIVYNMEEFETLAQRGIDSSMISEIQIDQSLIGWKEYELEVMRDRADNVVIVCSIENFDPMGVHTGDSITVAPAQTLTDKEYQRMRDASIAVIRAIGVETGGSNIQFAINPVNGDMVVVEMNPRVSRSSALASKATGFPIAKIAAKLAVGYTLDELPNDITKKTVACFEPSIDYVVVKIPRWTFEKFPDADETLTTQMKSVGEAMSIGRTFKEALQKGIRSMEVKRFGLGLDKIDKWWRFESIRQSGEMSNRRGEIAPPAAPANDKPVKTLGDRGSDMVRKQSEEEAATTWPIDDDRIRRKLAVPSQGRMYYIRYAFKAGWTVNQVFQLTNIDPWFLTHMKQLVDFEDELVDIEKTAPRFNDPAVENHEKCGKYGDLLRRAKEWGYSDIQLATVWNTTAKAVRQVREVCGIKPVYKLVDTCAAEFEAATPYYYSAYESPVNKLVDGKLQPVPDDEIRVSQRKKVIILGGGPNRIGQGIEFDYCCVQAAFAAKELGFESVMVNSNPETVSTDYDTSDLLFFEPLTHEDVLNIVERLNGKPLLPSTQLKDFTGMQSQSKAVKDVFPKALVLSGGEARFDLPQDVFAAVGKAILDKKLGPTAIVQSVRSMNDTSKHPLYYLLTSDNRLFAAGVSDDASNVSLYEEDPVSAMSHMDAQAVAHAREWFTKETAIRNSFEPLTALDANKDGLVAGVIVQFGGQTPLNLARGLKDAGVPIIGTAVESIETAEDRKLFNEMITKLGLRQPQGGTARSAEEARGVADAIGYPVLVRPSFVLGGRAMEIVSDEEQLNYYIQNAVEVADEHPVLIDRFLGDATEMDVDCIGDGTDYVICGLMEHIEEAGIHSGDSACSLPPFSLKKEILEEVRRNTLMMARELKVRGLMNVQFAIKDDLVYILEVNPRASRTVPFVSKATGISWARIAAKVMMGKSLKELGITGEVIPTKHVAVKESVFPFAKFPGVDVILGPEMRSTGEVMGIDTNFPLAYAKSQMAASGALPTAGTIYVSVRRTDKPGIVPIARKFAELGFKLLATGGTYSVLIEAGVPAQRMNKIQEGRPNIIDAIKNKQLCMLINTPTNKGPKTDEGRIRAAAVMNKIPIITTLTAAAAAADAIEALKAGDWGVKSLQEYYAE